LLLSVALVVNVVVLAAALLPSRVAIEPARPVAPPRRVIEVAITVDDLPRPPVGSSQRSSLGVLGALQRAFARHRLPPVTGFLNGIAVREDVDRAALEGWVSAGHLLGNHTFSHLDPARVTLAEYFADLARNEPLLASLAPAPSWKLFRYPYLQEGSDAAMHQAIRAHVLERGYRVAPVTIDFKDWVWSPVWARCSAHGDVAERDRLRELWREHARESLRWSDRAGRRLFGRAVRHVLLIHALDYTAERIDDLLVDYAALGVRFVSLERALEDPALARDPDFAADYGAPLLHKLVYARSGALPPAPEAPFDELERLCRAPGPSRRTAQIE
jgi:peptidoglycan/xylan/chitin deacetylase (PgdA/CDA1 family)